MAKDPICEMTVDEKGAKYTTEHSGRIYYFCNPSCKSVFERNPSRYTNK